MSGANGSAAALADATTASLPLGWEWCPLGDLGDWSGGGTPSKGNPAYWTDGDVPWVSPKDMKVPVLADAIDHITESAATESAAKKRPANSIAVVVRSGILEHTLPIALVPFEASYNQDMKVLTPGPSVMAEWVTLVLRAFETEILAACRKAGTTVASLDFSKLKAFEVPVPPPAEQQAIVATVDHLVTVLERAEGSVAKADRLAVALRSSSLAASVKGSFATTTAVQSGDTRLADILAERKALWSNGKYREPLEVPASQQTENLPAGWIWATVDQLSTLVRYGSSAKTSSDPTGVAVLRMGNIVEGRLDFTDLKYLPHDHDEFPDLLLEPGDVLFNRTNSAELVGKAAVYDGSVAPCSFASYLIQVRLVPSVRPELLVFFLSSALGRVWVKSVVSQQTGQANVNGSKLRQLAIPVPPASEQDAVCQIASDWIERARSTRSDARLLAARSRNLRRAIMRRAITGELH